MYLVYVSVLFRQASLVIAGYKDPVEVVSLTTFGGRVGDLRLFAERSPGTKIHNGLIVCQTPRPDETVILVDDEDSAIVGGENLFNKLRLVLYKDIGHRFIHIQTVALGR